MKFRRAGLLACLVVVAAPVSPVSAQSLNPWNIHWDVQIGDYVAEEAIEEWLESASSFYEGLGFKRPYFRDGTCNQSDTIVVTRNTSEILEYPAAAGNFPLLYFATRGPCGLGVLSINFEAFMRLPLEQRKLFVGMELFAAVMMAYEYYRDERPFSDDNYENLWIPKDQWFTFALRLGMAYAWLDGATGFNFTDLNERSNRTFGAPLHAPPCAANPKCGDNDGTWLFWALVATMSGQQAGNAIGLILDKPLDGEWQSNFYLDSVDAGLHEVLANWCSTMSSAMSESYGGVCQGLCGGHKPIRIRYLDVEEGREGHEEELQSCDDPVGGLHFIYPMFATYLVYYYDNIEQEVVEQMFPVRPGREYPAGCVQATVGDELTLSLEPMGIECVIVEGLPRKSGPLFLVDARASDPEILANLHLSWDKCAYAGELIDWENGSWTKYWDVDRSVAPVPNCVGEGDKVVLTFTNVATRASETKAIHDLRLNLLHYYRGEVR